ncbi:phosphate transport system regulatory protein PhoU [Geothermobacter hydrogeniphilus]|uniref:Phosphate-specific transport system accessory protein PhoU n=1 Tax=Geothermobacter hydrogeniphilus TaxID=1969733 RepID=A0A2K2HAK9_9BACT|nr:phosphate signaling complex protein PhoU [Geothermobacter hydrogeniphilus]PNU20263.1 phosphate transport system regulatory protein PhoU [Geothermobacter hydrogeniphilus]
MTVHMLREMEKLKKMILALAALVEESVQQGVLALLKRDAGLARKVIEMGDQVNQLEVDLEEECLKILALHQPVAVDLRYIVAVLKINNDFERINDLAGNLAERALQLMNEPELEPPFAVQRMSEVVEKMLKKTLDSLVNMDQDLAMEVLDLDDEVDSLHRDSFARTKDRIRNRPEELDGLIQYLSISRYLERIADLTTNVAEDVVYMIEGKIIRHHNTA